MNRDKVLKWVEALESGEYKQGTGQLVQKNEEGKLEFCCLGVAYKVCRPKKKFITEHATLIGVDNKLAEELGLIVDDYSSIQDKYYSSIQDKLVSFNDDYDKSFPWIAKWIRKNILKEKGIRLR